MESDTTTERKLQEIQDFFNETVLGWMINDLRNSVTAKTNYLTALGCLTYTEAVGCFLPPLSPDTGSDTEEKRFYRCLFRFKSTDHLKELDKNTRLETRKGLYGNLRNSGAHSYFFMVKKETAEGAHFYPVAVTDSLTNKSDGLAAAPLVIDKHSGQFYIATSNYISELEEAAKEFKKKICDDKDPVWVESGIKGIDYIIRGLRT